MTTAWLRALRHSVTVKRNATLVSASGASRFDYAVVATGLKCSLQDAGGRMSQGDVGQDPGRRKSLIADVDGAVLQQNDLLVDEVSGEQYKLFHLHFVNDPHAPHYEGQVEQWPPAGGT